MKLFAAPIQGYTDVPYRHFHAQLYAPADVYCAPFMHIEHGEPRKRDLRDITSSMNANCTTLPQIIFKDFSEFQVLAQAVADAGYKTLDLNLGCPFPPQVKRGRGAGIIGNTDCLKQICRHMLSTPETTYSIKMRLGVTDEHEWRKIADIVNDMPLSHVTIHPRIAKQQYSGDLYMNEFSEAIAAIKHRIVYNGDISIPEDIRRLSTQYPELYGIMIGRGLLARPSIIEEWRNGNEWSLEMQQERLLEMHERILSHYESCLCGDAQILAKIKPFWDYAESIIGRKSAKLIKKANSMNAYRNATASIGNV